MFRNISRLISFSRNQRHSQQLREFNKQLLFEDTIQTYKSLPKLSYDEELKCKQEYLYAVTNQKLFTPQPASHLGLSEQIYVKFVQHETPSSTLLKHLESLANGLLIAGALYLITVRLKNGPREGTDLFDSKKSVMVVEESNVTFDDVKGIDECREELEEIVHYLKNPSLFHKSGAKMPKGLLLTGQPGTGKTLLAKAIAGQAGVKFFYSSGSEFEEVFVGLGAKRVRELFAQAKKNAPCIVFIDEIDVLGFTRQSRGDRNNRQSLNQLLVEMDGFQAKDNILVIGATNFPKALDEALLRSGRFDKTIHVPLPDLQGRTEILELYLAKIFHDDTVNAQDIARITTGMSGADLKNLVNLAILNAIKEGRSTCTQHDINVAWDRVEMGIARRKIISHEEKMTVAVHELGHAIIGHLTAGANKVRKISIIPRTHMQGVTITTPGKNQLYITKQQLYAQIDVCMGGRVAEEIFYGEDNTTSGYGSDMKKATQAAYTLVRSGLVDEKTGVIYADDSSIEGLKQKKLIDDIVNEILEDSHKRVRAQIQKYRHVIQAIAQELVKSETMEREEFLFQLRKFNLQFVNGQIR